MKIVVWDYLVGFGVFVAGISLGVLNEEPAYSLLFIGVSCIVYPIIRLIIEHI